MRTLLEKHDHIVQEIHGQNDFGEDLYVTFTDQGQVTSDVIRVQVKGGDRWRRANGYGVPFVTQAHLYVGRYRGRQAVLTHLGEMSGTDFDPADHVLHFVNGNDEDLIFWKRPGDALATLLLSAQDWDPYLISLESLMRSEIPPPEDGPDGRPAGHRGLGKQTKDRRTLSTVSVRDVRAAWTSHPRNTQTSQRT